MLALAVKSSVYTIYHLGYYHPIRCTVDEIDYLLNHRSGLLGVSGVSNDLRQIRLEIDRGNERAQLGFDVFIHRLRSCIGAMVASLGGIDALIFTAGIGENSAAVRTAACENWEFLGLSLDSIQNDANGDRDIAHPDSRVRVLVIHTQEDWEIAQD